MAACRLAYSLIRSAAISCTEERTRFFTLLHSLPPRLYTLGVFLLAADILLHLVDLFHRDVQLVVAGVLDQQIIFVTAVHLQRLDASIPADAVIDVHHIIARFQILIILDLLRIIHLGRAAGPPAPLGEHFPFRNHRQPNTAHLKAAQQGADPDHGTSRGRGILRRILRRLHAIIGEDPDQALGPLLRAGGEDDPVTPLDPPLPFRLQTCIWPWNCCIPRQRIWTMFWGWNARRLAS